MKKAIKKAIKAILSFIKNSILFLVFIMRYIYNGPFRKRLPLKPKNGKTITLLANAPSLKTVLPRLATDEEFKHTDFVVLNYFANTPEFFHIKPQHYCFADPMFYRATGNMEKAQKLFELLNQKIDWDMNLYIISGCEKQFLDFSHLTNPKLHIVSVVIDGYEGFPSLRNWAYKHDYAAPAFSTVAIMALFISINQGYSNIHVYGVDHTVFEGLCVNDKNQPCWKETHFYEGAPKVKPIIRSDNNQVFKMADFIQLFADVFHSHDLIENYAESVETKILNCSPSSLVDSYPRAQIHNA